MVRLETSALNNYGQFYSPHVSAQANSVSNSNGKGNSISRQSFPNGNNNNEQ